MKTCAKIFSEINLEPGHISPCCNTRGLLTPVYPFKGGPIALQDYTKFLQQTADELQKDTKLCSKCPDLKTIPHPEVRPLNFHAVSINMHRFFCNCKCVYCNYWKNRQKQTPYDPLPVLKSLKDQNALAGNCWISWGGGEPSILPTFDASCDWALENNIFQYVHTNALRFSPAIAKALRRKKVGINVSLDSSSASVYKRVKGIDGFQKVMDTVKKYAQYGPEAITLKYIVFEETNDPAEISGFIKLCKGLNVGSVQYSLNFQESNAGKVGSKTLLGAAFLKKQAEAAQLNCVPSFIDKTWLEKIDTLTAKL